MINIAICDNEECELRTLREIITEIMSQYKIPCEIYDFRKGEDLLESGMEFQLVFLDIIMDGKNGIDIGNEIYRRNRRIKIIYQTNFSQYCKEAINHSHAFAYLEKPLTKKVVEEQIEEFLKCEESVKETRIEFEKVTVVQNGIPIERQVVSLPVDKIIYFEYLKAQRRIRIVTEDTEYIYKETMNVLENRMKPFGFEISCRGILVNLAKVIKIEGYTVLMSNERRIALSQRRVLEFKMRMNDYIHNSLQ